MKVRILKLILFIFLLNSNVHAQIQNFEFGRTLENTEIGWNTLDLPVDVYEHIKSDFSDIRIYGISEIGDTIEAPYRIRENRISISENVSYKLFNKSRNDKGYYYSFDISNNETINEITLNFEVDNFDFRVALQGSNQGEDWMTILDDYRIVGIENEDANYKFTKLKFPKSRYSTYRVVVKTDSDPGLTNVSIGRRESVEIPKEEVPALNFKVEHRSAERKTRAFIELEREVPIWNIEVHVGDTLDFFRTMKIAYLYDSVQTDKGWMYNYTNIVRTSLNSFEEPVYSIGGYFAKKLKLTIENRDNQPLHIDSVTVNRVKTKLDFRVSEEAKYILCYGDLSATKPEYDIVRFASKIPIDPNEVAPAKSFRMSEGMDDVSQPIFKNKIWLWIIMGVIIMALAIFSFKMIKST